MKKILVSLLAISALMSSCHSQPGKGSFEPVAVIELFTSEGCSSCPPADRLLGHYAQDSMYHGVHVYSLAFHVDYWDYLGWRDSFSSPIATDRQRMYVEALGLSGAYTPQMVVNGTDQFNGSDESTLKSVLSDISQKKAPTSFSKLEVNKANDRLKVHYALSEFSIDHYEIHFALLAKHVSTAVKRGENTGRRLEHTNVVRQFITQKADRSGDAFFDHISHFDISNTTVVAYLQQVSDHHIIAAAEVRP
jgi:hypothetical protein